MIKRDLLVKLNNEFDKSHITALIGARQVGKTTLLKQLFEQVKNESVFINFDKVEILNLFNDNIELFIKQYILPYKYIFIDEIQYSNKSGKYLKYILDDFNKKIFISGSSTPELSIKTISYLVGRIRIFNIPGISFKEFIEYNDKTKLVLLNDLNSQSGLKQLNNLFEEYLLFGSYPAVIVEKNTEDKKQILKDIINTYLLKEIREILQFKDSYKFEFFLKRLSLSDGKLVNYSNISKDADLQLRQIKEMINILEKTFIISIIQPYQDNKIKELIKSPKLYYSDLGFKNSLINNFSNMSLRLDKGEILEHFILNFLISNNEKINFWNYKNEYEVDFVYEKDGLMNAIEIKSRLNNLKVTTSMKKFIDSYAPKQLFVFNENLDGELFYNDTKIIFTNYINIYSLLK